MRSLKREPAAGGTTEARLSSGRSALEISRLLQVRALEGFRAEDLEAAVRRRGVDAEGCSVARLRLSTSSKLITFCGGGGTGGALRAWCHPQNQASPVRH